MLTRRTALALPLVAVIPAEALASKGSWLSCFLVDKLPANYTVSEGPMRAEYDIDQFGISLGYPDGDGSFFFRFWGSNSTTYSQGRYSKGHSTMWVTPGDWTDAELETAAAEMLSSAVQLTQFDAFHEHHRYITVEGEPLLSVSAPEYLGRLVIFPDGRRGLAIHNSAAVVKA